MRDEVLGQVAARRAPALFRGGLPVSLAAIAISCSAPPPPPPPTVAIARVASEPPPVLEPEPSAAPRAPRGPEGPTSIAWETDESTARQLARRRGMPMLVWARAEWAAAAIQMERTTWSDPRVAAAARRFVALKLDVTETEGDAELYAERYGVTMMPETVFFDASGQRTGSVRGTASVSELLAAMARASE